MINKETIDKALRFIDRLKAKANRDYPGGFAGLVNDAAMDLIYRNMDIIIDTEKKLEDEDSDSELLHSIEVAREAGVPEEKILHSLEEGEAFFTNSDSES